MNFIEAIRSGKPLRLKDRCFSYNSQWGYGEITQIIPGTWIAPEYLLENIMLKKEDILSEEWETKE